MPMTPEQMYAAITANLPAKTGKTLAEWVEIVRAQGQMTWKQRVEWLKREHGLGHGQAQVVAWEVDKSPETAPAEPDDLIAAQYAGDKGALRPVYERLVAAISALGADARLEARQTYVSLVRRKQFGVIQPTSRARVSVGLVLPDTILGERLKAAGSFGSGRVTHRVDLASADEVGAELEGWLKAAYEGAA
jgi:hypothetical protein